MNRNSLFFSLSLSFFALIWMASTCAPTPPPPPPPPSTSDACVDESKKDPNAVCTKEFIPVCGCDGQTYSNACLAEKAGVLLFTKGKCGSCIDPEKINPKQACTREYKPVCGCNNVTYSNECLAKINGVKTWTKGKCGATNTGSTDCIDPKKIDANKPCTREYKPVCACDGKTYPNACEAEKAGVTAMTEGKCHKCQDAKLIKNEAIPLVYKPVCGCNNRTYSNEYAARNAGITKFSEGPCKTDGDDGDDSNSTDCIDPRQAKPDMACPEIYRPVCGCDGKTYSNACEARRVGVTEWKPGKCE